MKNWFQYKGASDEEAKALHERLLGGKVHQSLSYSYLCQLLSLLFAFVTVCRALAIEIISRHV